MPDPQPPTPQPPAPQPVPPVNPPVDPPTPPTPGDPSGVQIPKVRFDEVNERMKTAEAELQRLRDAQQTAEDERLANDKKFEELAAKRTTERDEWKGKAETAEQRLDALESRLHAIADERTKALPEKLQARVPAQDKSGAVERLEKIEELEAVLAELPNAPPAPGNGPRPKPAGSPDPKKLVDEAVERALRSGGYGF